MNNNSNSLGGTGDPNKAAKTDYSNPYVRIVPKLQSPKGAGATVVDLASAVAGGQQQNRLGLGQDTSKTANDSKRQGAEDASGTVGTKLDRAGQVEGNEDHEDLIDIPLQLKQQRSGQQQYRDTEGQALGQEVLEEVQREDQLHQQQANQQDYGNGSNNQYQFLKFHMIEDENATDESNKSTELRDNFARRKSSQNSHLSKGSGQQNSKKVHVKNAAMVNNFLHGGSNQIHNAVVSSVIKQQGWDKMKNLKSVLEQRKSTKGASGTRTQAKTRKSSGEPHNLNMQNQQKAVNRKSSQEQGKRPPSSSSKNSGKAGGKMRVPLQNAAKPRENPMIMLTAGGGGKPTKKHSVDKKHPMAEPMGTSVADIDKPSDGFDEQQPDNEYLETMKMRMRGLPELTKSSSNIQQLTAQSQDKLDNMDTQEIINRANEALQKKAQGGSGQQKDKSPNSGGGKSYSVRAIKRKEDGERKASESRELFNSGGQIDTTPTRGSDPMATFPQEEDADNSIQMIDDMFGVNAGEAAGGGRQTSHTYRKPKFLVNKLTNLMRDTKSSAQRNRFRAQQTTQSYGGQSLSISGPSFTNLDDVGGPRKSPAKPSQKPGSPKKRHHSPFQKQKFYVTRSSQNLPGIISMKQVAPGKFEQVKERRGGEGGDDAHDLVATLENSQFDSRALRLSQFAKYASTSDVAEAQPRVAEIPATDSPSQVTLEGISGMVVMDANARRYKLGAGGEEEEDEEPRSEETPLPYDGADIKKGESGLSSSSSSERVNTEGQSSSKNSQPADAAYQSAEQRHMNSPLKRTLDLESIRIDQKDLHDISKSSREQQDKRTTKINEFNSEIRTIIGSINSRAKDLKAKFSVNTQLAKQQSETSARDPTGNDSDLLLEQAQSAKQFDINHESLSYSQQSKRANTNRTGSGGIKRALTDDKLSGPAAVDDEDDPLKAVALDLSSEANDLDEKSINDNNPKKYSNLDQTIVIGEMDEGNIFDDLKIAKSATEGMDRSSELNRPMSQFTDLELERLKEKNDDDKNIKIAIEDLQELVDNIKLKHRAEIDAIMNEQGAYKRIIQGLISKIKQNKQTICSQDVKIQGLQKYEVQARKFEEYNSKLQSEVQFYRDQVDRFKIALIEYDKHVRESVIQPNEFHIQQLETENAHLRKLLNIPEELFKVDPEEEKKREAEKKRGVLLSIDEKLKAAEKKIARKHTVQEIHYQNQKQHGFDPFSLEQEEYDMFKLGKLKEVKDMPQAMKSQVQGKLQNKIEERQYREEVRRRQEKEILQEFARVYGYDINKHQPDPNGGEIDVEYLQAYIAECRQKEDRLAEKIEAEKSLAKQKEALKGKVKEVTKPKQVQQSTNNQGTKSAAPASKKQLTVETDNTVASQGQATTPDSEQNASNSQHSEKPSPSQSSGLNIVENNDPEEEKAGESQKLTLQVPQQQKQPEESPESSENKNFGKAHMQSLTGNSEEKGVEKQKDDKDVLDQQNEDPARQQDPLSPLGDPQQPPPESPDTFHNQSLSSEDAETPTEVISVKHGQHDDDDDERMDEDSSPDQLPQNENTTNPNNQDGFDPYSSSLALTFKAGQTGEALDFGQTLNNQTKYEDEDEEEEVEEEDGDLNDRVEDGDQGQVVAGGAGASNNQQISSNDEKQKQLSGEGGIESTKNEHGQNTDNLQKEGIEKQEEQKKEDMQ